MGSTRQHFYIFSLSSLFSLPLFSPSFLLSSPFLFFSSGAEQSRAESGPIRRARRTPLLTCARPTGGARQARLAARAPLRLVTAAWPSTGGRRAPSSRDARAAMPAPTQLCSSVSVRPPQKEPASSTRARSISGRRPPSKTTWRLAAGSSPSGGRGLPCALSLFTAAASARWLAGTSSTVPLSPLSLSPWAGPTRPYREWAYLRFRQRKIDLPER